LVVHFLSPCLKKHTPFRSRTKGSVFFRGTTLVDSIVPTSCDWRHASRCPEITVGGPFRLVAARIGRWVRASFATEPLSHRVLLSGRSAGLTGLRHRVLQMIQLGLYHYAPE